MVREAHRADVVYPRWRDTSGREFPFSAYNRDVHLMGLDFVGTDVLLSESAANAYILLCDGEMEISDVLRELARDPAFTFHGVDAVTYTRFGYARR